MKLIGSIILLTVLCFVFGGVKIKSDTELETIIVTICFYSFCIFLSYIGYKLLTK